MKYQIDPKIDCVFKAILGAIDNCNLLTHFLNAILANNLGTPITAVEILNPYNDREFIDDKLSIVDVKAMDQRERIYQVEIQMLTYRALTARILYMWADIYSKQLQSGDNYYLLKPTYAIWLVAEKFILHDNDYLHVCPLLRDTEGRILLDHGGIWIIELEKFSRPVENERDRWLQFFKSGDQLDEANLPQWMSTPEMEQAMITLRQFSEKEKNYHLYQARKNYLRQQHTIQWERDEERKEKEQALLREQMAFKEKEAAEKREQQAIQREQQAMQEKQQAMQEKISAERAILEKEKEIEHLKALLSVSK